MVRTRHAGIYKRGSRYVATYRAGGKQRRESARTLDEALRIKRARETSRDRGEFELVEQARSPFRVFASEWITRYAGNGRRGFAEDTREDYRRDLERYAFPFFGEKTVAGLSPRDVAEFIRWLCDADAQGKRLAEERRAAKAAKRKVPPSTLALEVKPNPLADATVRRILAPVRACLASAKREGLIRANPVTGAALPHRPTVEDGEPVARALTRTELARFLDACPSEWRLLFRFLAVSGLRWGEVSALRWSELQLEGSSPYVKVRRALARRRHGGDAEFKPPKSKYGIRDVPLDPAVAFELRRLRSEQEPADDALVFPATNGGPLRHENVRRRVLKPASIRAGVNWMGFHTLRHTCASLLFDAGRNAKQVQRWLGHHSPAFTLARYVHLMDEGVGEGLNLAVELAEGDNGVATDLREREGSERDLALVGSP